MKVGVIGAGTMGQGIAKAFAQCEGYTVALSLSDELDHLMKLELLVTREDMAKTLQKRFRADAEQIYSQILAVFFDHESGGKPDSQPEP